MRTAKLVELNRIEVTETPVPEPVLEDDVQVRVKAVGICGTDLHMFREPRADVTLPRIMGHELAGVVTKIGKNVTRVKVGDRVVLDPVFACGDCPACRKGYPNVCSSVRCYGVQMDGGYQDYIVVGEKHLYPFDEAIPFEEAALAEPFSIAANIAERAQLTAEDKVLILGSGTIGLAVLQTAKSMGAFTAVADIAEEKLQIARRMGADCAVQSNPEALKTAMEEIAPDGFDVIVDAVGMSKMLQMSIDYAAPRGRIICLGFDANEALIPPVKVTKKELSIIGSRMNCCQFPKVMEWLNERKINAEAMISKTYSILEIQKAFEETIANSADNVKTVIVFDDYISSSTIR